MADRGLESEGVAGELSKNKDVWMQPVGGEEDCQSEVDRGREGKKEQVASQSWVDYETRYWPIQSTCPVKQFKKIRYTVDFKAKMNPM